MLFNRKAKPKPIELPEFSFYRGAGSFNDWLSTLPEVDGQMMARQILEALKEVHNADCSFEQLLEIASLLEERYCRIRDSLSPIVENKQYQKTFSLLRQDFFAKFGRLFIKVGMVAAQSDNQKDATRFLILASEALGSSITASYQLYRPPVSGGWLALHKGYLYLVTRCGNPELTKSYSKHYRSVVALACLQPAQLNTENINQLITLISERAKDIKLSPTPTADSTHRIVTGRDQAPQLLQSETASAEVVGDSVYVNLSELVDLSEEERCNNVLRRHLERVFEFKFRDKNGRVSTNEPLKIGISLSAIHQDTTGEGNFGAFIKECLLQDGEDAPLIETKSKSGNDVWDSVYEGKWDTLEDPSDLINFAVETGYIEDNGEEDVVALDKSQSGFLLSSEHPLKNIESGSLISIKRENSPDRILAAVRWNHQDAENCKFGVQKFCINPAPASIKIIHSQNSSGYLPALRLSPEPDEDNYLPTPDLMLECELPERSIILAIPVLHLRSKTPISYLGIKGSRKAIITESIDETPNFIICRARFTD